MKFRFALIAVVLSLIPVFSAFAQTYKIPVLVTGGTCDQTSTKPVYEFTINGDSVVVRSSLGSGFTTKINSSGQFKVTFKSFYKNRDDVAEGNVTAGHRTLKITTQRGCVFEGAESTSP